jgi:hypothetical protein
MHNRPPKIIATLVALPFVAGCGASIELQRGDIDLAEQFESSKFFLVFEGGSGSKADNWLDDQNLIWTNDEKRKEVVAESILYLIGELEKNGFVFVDTKSGGPVLASLRFKSVRFDPMAGWITDGAQISYLSAENGDELGTVVADEGFITPKVKVVFDALIKGSLELWGRAPEE